MLRPTQLPSLSWLSRSASVAERASASSAFIAERALRRGQLPSLSALRPAQLPSLSVLRPAQLPSLSWGRPAQLPSLSVLRSQLPVAERAAASSASIAERAASTSCAEVAAPIDICEDCRQMHSEGDSASDPLKARVASLRSAPPVCRRRQCQDHGLAQVHEWIACRDVSPELPDAEAAIIDGSVVEDHHATVRHLWQPSLEIGADGIVAVQAIDK